MIRAATAADLDAIMLIERRSFPTDAWSVELMAAELASPHGRYFVDVENGAEQAEGEHVVGYGGVRALRGSADSDIQTIALDAEHRGSGRGRALLRALLAEAAERGAREVFLEVRADNPVAQGLYLSEGFAEIGRRAGYYQPDDVDAVIMKLDLRGKGSDD
ncbi:ribosomal protein S18-alanine N-acetyltransferase [Microbacterium sp. 2MCAF23]